MIYPPQWKFRGMAVISGPLCSDAPYRHKITQGPEEDRCGLIDHGGCSILVRLRHTVTR